MTQTTATVTPRRLAIWDSYFTTTRACAALMAVMAAIQLGAFLPPTSATPVVRWLLLATAPLWLALAVVTWRKPHGLRATALAVFGVGHVVMHFFGAHAVEGAAAASQVAFGLGAIGLATFVLGSGGLGISPLKLTITLVASAMALLAMFVFLVSRFSSDDAGQGYEWSESIYLSDANLEHRMRPNAVQKIYYSNNPRAYFDVEPPTSQLDPRFFALLESKGARAHLTLPDNPHAPLRVTLTALGNRQAYEVALYQALPHLSAGSRWRVQLEGRADRPRPAELALVQIQPSFRVLSQVATLELTPRWQSFDLPFDLGAELDGIRLQLQIGQSDVPLEFKQVQLVGPPAAAPLFPARFSVKFQTNSAGFRDVERAQEKPPRVFRVACLGDSFTFGQGVKAGDRCTDLLERRLNERFRGSPKIEVLNFGTCGYSTRLERILYEEVARNFRPDMVLVFMVSNDFASPAEEKAIAKARAQQQPGGWFSLRRAHWALELFRPIDYSGCVAEILCLSELCRADGARLGVITFGFDWQPGNRLEADISRGLAADSLPVLHLRDGLRQNHSADELRVNEADGHPNEIAHRLAAELVEQFLDHSGLLPGGMRNRPDQSSSATDQGRSTAPTEGDSAS